MTIIVTLALSALFAVLLAGFTALHKAQRSAVDGYEDEAGFHFGTDHGPAAQQTESATVIHVGSDQAA